MSDRNGGSEEPACRTWTLAFIFILFISFILPFIVFVTYPQWFYYRPWEYSNEISFPGQNRSCWDGMEYGSESRKFFFKYQDSWHTHVSWDKDGYRSVPYQSENYPVVTWGDSQTWGSGISDNETFPWLLAEELKIPVFNGGKDDGGQNVFKKHSNRNATIAMYLTDFNHIWLGSQRFNTSWSDVPYHSVSEGRQIAIVKRWYPPAKILTRLEDLINELKKNTRGLNEYMLSDYGRIRYNEKDMESQVDNITRFSRFMNEKGYTYVLVLIPDRSVLYSNHTDEYSLNYSTRISEKLSKNGVYVVDLFPSFYHNRQDGLYLRTDTHWDANGTRIAASVVAEYLKHHNLLDGISSIDADRSGQYSMPRGSSNG